MNCLDYVIANGYTYQIAQRLGVQFAEYAGTVCFSGSDADIQLARQFFIASAARQQPQYA